MTRGAVDTKVPSLLGCCTTTSAKRLAAYTPRSSPGCPLFIRATKLRRLGNPVSGSAMSSARTRTAGSAAMAIRMEGMRNRERIILGAIWFLPDFGRPVRDMQHGRYLRQPGGHHL